MSRRESSAESGISMGCAFAVALSWTTWHSFWWAILHGIFGWVYVGYFFLLANHDADVRTYQAELCESVQCEAPE